VGKCRSKMRHLLRESGKRVMRGSTTEMGRATLKKRGLSFQWGGGKKTGG